MSNNNPEERQLEHYDLIIVGGGVNGTGVARDAALRGLTVCLLEKGDLGGATSSSSTKLIHGGLRYLEYGAFSLVRSALIERRLLMSLLPGFIRPMRFILPLKKRMRSWLLLRLGLWVYDHLGPRGSLARSAAVTLAGTEFGAPLKDVIKRGFEYSDGWVDDARLVILNAVEAKALGAEICPRAEVMAARRDEGQWQVTLADGRVLTARGLVNAAGPFVNQFIETRMEGHAALPLRLVRGSHIVVPKLFDHDRAYMLQQPDGRIVFVIPFEKNFTLVGTTEAEQTGGLDAVEASDDEIDYLIRAVNRDFKRQINKAAVQWTFAGVRPLFDAGEKAAKAASRDYHLAVEAASDVPVVHVYGGKITTFRKLAADVVDKFMPYFDRLGPTKTDRTPFAPFEREGYEDWLEGFHHRLSFLPPSMRARWAAAYGRRADWFLRGVGSVDDLGGYFGGGLYEREVRYLVTHEWAQSGEDVLWRRSKCGLHMTGEERQKLADWMASAQLVPGAGEVSAQH